MSALLIPLFVLVCFYIFHVITTYELAALFIGLVMVDITWTLCEQLQSMEREFNGFEKRLMGELKEHRKLHQAKDLQDLFTRVQRE